MDDDFAEQQNQQQFDVISVIIAYMSVSSLFIFHQ
jgi:hypothetical protein